MRTWLSFLLVITLVLRGLLGNAMAMGVVAPVMPASHTAHSQPSVPEHGTPAVSNHLTAHPNHSGNDSEHSLHQAVQLTAGHCTPSSAHDCGADSAHGSGACSACGICHSSAGLPSLMAAPLPAPCAQHIAAFAARFVSTAPAALVKPPISTL